MKNIIFICSLIVLLASCKQDPAPIVDYAILSGKINNNLTGEISINSTDFKLDKSNAKIAFKQTITLSEDGSFIDTLKVRPGHYILFDGKEMVRLYIEIGNNIVINGDSKDFVNTLSYTGSGSDKCDYLLEKQKTETEILGTNITIFMNYMLNETDFKSKFKTCNKKVTELLNTYNGFTEDFKALEIKNLQYNYLFYLSMYPEFYPIFGQKPDYKVSKDFLNEMDDISYDNEKDFFYSDMYKHLVEAYYDNKASEFAEQNSITEEIAYLKTVGTVENEKIKNELLLRHAYMAMNQTKDIDTYYNTIMPIVTNEDNKKKITKNYKAITALVIGSPSPKFLSYRNHKGGTTSLDDFKGKFVYIDVWATWCGPCIGEIPFLQEVEKKYHGKNIEFVSISIDEPKNHDKWEKMVTDEGFTGIQLLADKDFASKFMQDYSVKFIPRFILIDPNGNIVSSKAPRPSEEKLLALFNENNI